MSMRIKPCCSKLRINYNKQNEAIGEPASKKKNRIKSKKRKVLAKKTTSQIAKE